jgi:DNA-binding transcriptional LysR family regulator
MDTTLQRLRYFVAVADELNFTRAAARLHVSQPSLSAQVRALERDVGTELLRRTTRRVELTEAGHSVLDDTRRLLEGLEEAGTRARRIADTAAGTLRVAYTASVGYHALPLILDELEARAPGLAVSANRAWSTRVLDQIRSGDADLGLVREFRQTRGITGETIRLEPLAVFASVRHPLAARAVVGIRDLEGQTLVLVPHALAPGFRDLVVSLCRRAGFEPLAIAPTAPDNREPLLAHLSRHAEHLFVGPVSMASVTWKGVVNVPIDDPEAVMGLSMVWATGASAPGIPIAAEAARAVSEREAWLERR